MSADFRDDPPDTRQELYWTLLRSEAAATVNTAPGWVLQFKLRDYPQLIGAEIDPSRLEFFLEPFADPAA